MIGGASGIAIQAIALVFCGVAAASPSESEPKRFLSPGLKHEVVFRALEHSIDKSTASAGCSYVAYSIEFNRTGSTHTVSVEYKDPYGAYGSSRPMATATIFSSMLWSPTEDFVVTDEEGWPSAPGTPVRTAVSLNPSLAWTTATFTMSDPAWIDSLRVIGNNHQDCRYSVDIFNGKTGHAASVMAPEEPNPGRIGYELEKIEKGMAVIRTVLDNCQTTGLDRDFVPKKIMLNAQKLR